jgi:lipopolysaccharide biosynthesis regulator YciM
MESDFGWLLWALPLVFALGWLASRLDLRQLRLENRQAPKAYFRGLNFLLNEQQDQAIDAFIEAVRNDPDTSELHFALGNLFRRRGEYERAVRVHEHLLSRGDLSRADRDRAQHALALDFLKAGLLDRAEDALRKLEGTAHEEQALLALLAIYERTRDWTQACTTARKLQAGGHGDFQGRLAHYLCEQAVPAAADQAQALLEEAQRVAPLAPRPSLDLANLHQRRGDPEAAFACLSALADTAPQAIGLIARPLAESARACGQIERARTLLRASFESSPSLDVVDALAQLETDPHASRHWYARHLEREPSLVAAAHWVQAQPGQAQTPQVAPGLTDPSPLGDAALRPHLQRALDHAARPLMRYRCAACGFESNRHFWQCPGCQAWDSYPARRVEEL